MKITREGIRNFNTPITHSDFVNFDGDLTFYCHCNCRFEATHYEYRKDTFKLDTPIYSAWIDCPNCGKACAVSHVTLEEKIKKWKARRNDN